VVVWATERTSGSSSELRRNKSGKPDRLHNESLMSQTDLRDALRKAHMLYTTVDAQCDKLATVVEVELSQHLRRSMCCCEIFLSSEFGTKFKREVREVAFIFAHTRIPLAYVTVQDKRVIGYAKNSSIRPAVSIERRLVTDGQTDRQTDRHRAIAIIPPRW